ncbi:MAG: PIN domain-containing protein [Actinomycetota bacterium]|nr:PIN domain-containing protein [Actinomycetota bacterium]
MIVVDTSVLVYAVGTEHPLRTSCREIVAALGDGLDATTTVEVIQEFAHVRARRRTRADAVKLARSYATAFAPLLLPTAEDLVDGLSLFEDHEDLRCFDAVLAAAAIARSANALVSADPAFSRIPSLNHVSPASPELPLLLGERG